MHLLVTQPGQISDGNEAVDLGQSPGEIVVLSAASSDLSLLSQARRELQADADQDPPSLRLANLMQLGHNMSVDIYLENTISHASLVVVRLLGGAGYWAYGVEQLSALCAEKNIMLAVVPGDDHPDPELADHSTLPTEACHRLWQYCAHGGGANALNFLKYCAHLLGHDSDWREPAPLVRAGLYWPGAGLPDLDAVRGQWIEGAPTAAIVFYRALVQSHDLAPVDALIEALAARGLNPLPIFVASLKDRACGEIVASYLADAGCDIILNLTGFAVSAPGAETRQTPFSAADCPVLQLILSGGDEAGWRDGSRGLSPRDLAMNVALPEVDGRIITRAISFKKAAEFDQRTEVALVRHQPVPDRIAFAGDLAAAWARLRKTPAAERRIAIIVANYPNKDGRLGNGVGLDTPAGVAASFKHLQETGYDLGAGTPVTGKDVMTHLLVGPTNAPGVRAAGIEYGLADYRAFFAGLPEDTRAEVEQRWGAPEDDPFFQDGAFRLAAHRFGNVTLAVQPARGYNIDPKSSYHDPDLAAPHGYLAFYAWLRCEMDVQAVIHFGKHGNLEWLPGKALALGETCFPEVALGPLPHIYPFIVNDPGEGTQAKRRAQGVIIDHLTPPLTRAESYGPLRDLEQLVDEYYLASGMDPRRLKLLGAEIIDLSRRIGLDHDVGIAADEAEQDSLAKIDNYLCELKELQIRDGLHVFGAAPEGGLAVDLLVALTRLPRGQGMGIDASLIRALAADLGFDGFDPLDCEMGAEWAGPKPDALAQGPDLADQPWRSNGDTVERLELLARALVAGDTAPDPSWTMTEPVLDFIRGSLAPMVAGCGAHELEGLIKGLDGRFVAPGSSGAPTRGRLDVLPTGRNFYSVDSRAIPTPAAWQLGWKSAGLLVEHHFQSQGEYPKRLALSAWGTANMRTGGDDIAQALALMGVRPEWDKQSGRVIGFEVMPASVLGRPRVDVVFRVSGFFRDAFPAQVDLLDQAARTVASLDEDAAANPLAAQVAKDAAAMRAQGLDEDTALKKAGYRVFGSKPGAYGAGLQALIDEKCWDGDADLARAYVAWGGYAYGVGAEGAAEQSLFEARLKGTQVVVHNQDNREHDILDSDDYYQFEGGIAAAVRHLSGAQPAIYHNDHSRPETPKIRTLSDEIGRVVRARAANPKWIEGVMRHGYKGAFEIAATVDYLFAFAATSAVVEDHHFNQLFEAYLEDVAVREFIEDSNPAALREIAERFEEAVERGFWHPRSNSAGALLANLIETKVA
ncbi:MAG: cobaltochelatase subunit CobN [Rhodospirillales bacterium]|jgi:cobaltochelatase CobN|nr:cobaltochelatase subunit CobN [Rhodospirillales bacterium]